MMQRWMRFSTANRVKTSSRFGRRLHQRAVLCMALALGLAACTAAKPAYQPGVVTFAAEPVWRLAADRILITEGPDVKPLDSSVRVRLAEPPVDIARRLAATRLRPDQSARATVTFHIERAEATERYLPRPKGVTAAFTNDPEAELTVTFSVMITAQNARGAKTGEARAEASVHAIRKEGADEDAKRRQWDEMIRDAATRLDAELNARIQTGLTHFIRPR